MKKYVKSDLNLNYDRAEFGSALESSIMKAADVYSEYTTGQKLDHAKKMKIFKLLDSTDISDKIYDIIINE